MKLRIDTVGVDQARESLRRIGGTLATRALASTVVDVEEIVENQAARHNGTGALVRSIYKKRIHDGWEIGHDPRVAPHAVFVHWGTGLWGPKRAKYPIKPKNKKALRWVGAGFVGPVNPNATGKVGRSGFVFAKGVMHPGIKGDPWLTRAARAAPAIFQRHVERLLAKNT